jgi:hypothetical protein
MNDVQEAQKHLSGVIKEIEDRLVEYRSYGSPKLDMEPTFPNKRGQIAEGEALIARLRPLVASGDLATLQKSYDEARTWLTTPR